MSDFVLYGAYGYTGRLIVQTAGQYGLRPLLAGRDADRLRALADTHGLDYVAVSLDDGPGLERLLAPYPVVLHAAGPFVRTAAAMHAACLASDTHYLDITGEIDAFALAYDRDAAFRTAGLMAMPGVGFDVVPTDCMAAFCHHRLPDATHLELAFAWQGGGVSHGTALTAVEGLGRPGTVRQDGRLQPVPPAHKTATFPFTADRDLLAVTIPWGDVFTAYHTTGIPNVETYIAAPPAQVRLMKLSRYLGPLLRTGWIKNFFRRRVKARPAGPNPARREAGEAYVFARVTNAAGQTFAARLRTPEGYTLTAHTALGITKKMLAGEVTPGFQTPAGVYGADLILEFPGSERTVLTA